MQVYSNAKCLLLLVSEEYLAKPWTNFEEKAALQNLQLHAGVRLLQLKIDAVDIPDIPTSEGTLAWHGDLHPVCALIASIIGEKPETEPINGVDEIKQVFSYCFRRAIFAAMAGEIDTNAMFNSIEQCIWQLDSYLPQMSNPVVSQYVKLILVDLNQLDSFRPLTFSFPMTSFFPEDTRKMLDVCKTNIVNVLNYLNQAFSARIDMPDRIDSQYAYGAIYNFQD